MPSQSEIQQQITARILDGLKNGVVPWRKTWKADPNSGSPANVISMRRSHPVRVSRARFIARPHSLRAAQKPKSRDRNDSVGNSPAIQMLD